MSNLECAIIHLNDVTIKNVNPSPLQAPSLFSSAPPITSLVFTHESPLCISDVLTIAVLPLAICRYDVWFYRLPLLHFCNVSTTSSEVIASATSSSLHGTVLGILSGEGGGCNPSNVRNQRVYELGFGINGWVYSLL